MPYSESSAASSGTDEEEDAKATEEIEKRRIEKDRLRREELRKQKEKRERRKRRIDEGRDTSSSESDSDNDSENNKADLSAESKVDSMDVSKESIQELGKRKAKEPKIDIWKKVTVGQLFEAALQRYLIRKAERGSRFPW